MMYLYMLHILIVPSESHKFAACSHTNGGLSDVFPFLHTLVSSWQCFEIGFRSALKDSCFASLQLYDCCMLNLSCVWNHLKSIQADGKGGTRSMLQAVLGIPKPQDSSGMFMGPWMSRNCEWTFFLSCLTDNQTEIRSTFLQFPNWCSCCAKASNSLQEMDELQLWLLAIAKPIGSKQCWAAELPWKAKWAKNTRSCQGWANPHIQRGWWIPGRWP